MVDDDHLVDIAYLPGKPFGKLNLDTLPVMVSARLQRSAVSHDKGLKEGVAGEAVGTVKSGAGDLTHRVESPKGSLPVEVGLYPSALIVGGRDHGNPLLGNVDAKFKALVMDHGETLPKEFSRLVGNIQIDARTTRALHLRVDRAGHHVTGGQLQARVVFLHEPPSPVIGQDPPFPTDRFGDQERFCLGVVEAGGVELHELHVGHRRPGPPCHGHTVAGRDVWIGCIEIDTTAPSRGEDRDIGADRLDGTARLVQHIETHTSILHGIAQLTGGDQVDRDAVLEDGDGGMGGDSCQQRLLDFQAGGVLGMEDAAFGVPSLASKIGFTMTVRSRSLVEMHSKTHKLGDPLRSFRDDRPNHLLMAESVTGDQRILHMKCHGIL